jgi:hypothetical protein
MTPLEAAVVVDHSSKPRELPWDRETQVYIADGTEPPTSLTPKEYDAALKVLDWRDEARAAHGKKRG